MSVNDCDAGLEHNQKPYLKNKKKHSKAPLGRKKIKLCKKDYF